MLEKNKIIPGAIFLTVIALIVTACYAAESPTRPKLLGIAYVTFRSSDLPKAEDFYAKELGLVPANSKFGNKIVSSFAVNQYQSIQLVKAPPGGGGSFLVEIGLATDNLPQMREYLTANGVPADRIASWPDGTKFFETADTEGNKIVFVEQHRTAPETGSASAVSHKLIHAGIIVKDADAENHFYKDILGFHVYWHGGMTDDTTNWMALQAPDGSDWIEYMLRIGPNPDKHTRGVMYHVSLGVPGIAAAAKDLEARGYSGFEPPKIGKDGKWQLNLYDPDDTRVELMEFTPVQRPCCSEFTGTHPTP